MIGQAPTTCGAWTTRVGGHLATAAAPTAVTTPACDPATAAEVVDALELMHDALEQAVFVIAGSGLATEHAQAEWRCSHDRTTEARVPKGTVTSLRFAKERIRPPSVLRPKSTRKCTRAPIGRVAECEPSQAGGLESQPPSSSNMDLSPQE